MSMEIASKKNTLVSQGFGSSSKQIKLKSTLQIKLKSTLQQSHVPLKAWAE